jgi:hypothetical protein
VFVPLPGTATSFTQAGPGRGCVIVVFTAELEQLADNQVNVRAILSGIGVAEPTEVSLKSDGASTFESAHGMQFVFPSVAPGSYTLRIQWRATEGELIAATERVVVVHHR